MTDSAGFGAWLKKRRQEAGLTQQQLADHVGVHRTYIVKIERGGIGLPGYELRQRLHRVLGASDDDLRTLGILPNIEADAPLDSQADATGSAAPQGAASPDQRIPSDFGTLQPYITLFLGKSKTMPLAISLALREALEAIAPAIHAPHRIDVVVDEAPFRVPFTNGEMVYTPGPDVIASHTNQIVFLNTPRLLALDHHQHRVACILEELIHAWMNASDYKDLITIMVAELYPGVRVVNGQWVAIDTEEP